MQPYLGPPSTNSCQIWCVRVFHHVLLKHCHENAEMQKRKFDDVTLQYSIIWISIDVRLILMSPYHSLALGLYFAVNQHITLCARKVISVFFSQNLSSTCKFRKFSERESSRRFLRKPALIGILFHTQLFDLLFYSNTHTQYFSFIK